MKITSLALDPIEKKPLARFYPGSTILSIGSYGCTMHCPWCQNHEIAQPSDPTRLPMRDLFPEQVADLAESLLDRGNIGVAYTYNEPFYRWREVLECARVVHARGLKNVIVTNGLIAPEKLEELLPFIDAFNIDLKGFSQDVYDVCGGTFEQVKTTIARANASSHVEVTTLLIPGLNDDSVQVELEAQWLASLDPVPLLHLTRFFPRYLYADHEPTPLETLHRARDIAGRYLDDVVLGNV